ncbi:protein Spindly-like [Chrysoperla carnea]|uniref:protein Spindly-like n=1 Tax=Chrysoperla carnea TaxID=189513 RepID=UPI001D068778|nr:protein Spindly-like [Chrysoperla carnea]
MEVPDEEETDDIREMKLIIEQQQLDINTYCCRNNNLISELNEIKNILEYKSQQLIDLNHLKESLNDEVATLRTELELLKTNVANPASKGNSLFGEVYDSREKLQKKLSLLKKHCIDIKSKYAVQLAENKKLSNENLILSKQWKDEVSNRFNIEYTWKGAHEQTIEGLKENIKFLKNEIKNLDKFSIPKVPLTEKWMYDNVKELYERNQKLIIEAEEKINQKIFGDLLLSERLNSVEREVNKWKSIATTYEIEKNNLQLELDRLKTKDDPMLNDPQELIELFKDIENKENVSLVSNSSVLNITVESDTSFYAEKLLNLKSENPKIKLEEGINNMKVSEENSIKIEKPKVTFKQENASVVKDKNVYHTPPPGRVFIPKRRIFVKSIKSEDAK